MEREEEIGGDGAEGGSGRGGRLCLYTRAGRTGRGCTISKPQCTPTHTHTRPAPGHASCSAPSTLHFSSLPFLPHLKKKIPSLSLIIPNKVPRQLRELGSYGAPGKSCLTYPTMNCPILSIPCSPRSSISLLFLPTSVTQKPYLDLETEPVCLFVCLSTLLTCLSCLVLSCLVLCLPHASSYFNYSASPIANRSHLPSLFHHSEYYYCALSSFLAFPPCFVSRFAACGPHQHLVCGWSFRSHACSSSPLGPQPDSHPTAVQLQHVSLSLVGRGGWSRLGCQLIEHSHTRHASIIHPVMFSHFPHTTTCMLESASSAA